MSLNLTRFTITLIYSVYLVYGQTVKSIGAFDGEEVRLPCHINSSNLDISAVWWQSQGILIGQFSNESGFEPSGYPGFENKYNMESLEGDLIVYSVNKTEDHNDVYTCGIILEDGTNFTDTKLVQLVVGYKPHDFDIENDGSPGAEMCDYDVTYVSCSVVSEPKSSIQWYINTYQDIDERCYEPLNQTVTTCSEVIRADGNIEYRCESTFLPHRKCYTWYGCEVKYSLVDLTDNPRREICTENNDWIYLAFAIWMSIFIAVVILLLCGILSCVLGGIALCKCFNCCCFKKNNPKQITPGNNSIKDIDSNNISLKTSSYHIVNENQ